jgi:toxin CcdB
MRMSMRVDPMTKVASLTRRLIRRLMTAVQFNGETYVLMTPQLADIARGELGAPAGSLAQHRNEIVAAMDFLLLGI